MLVACTVAKETIEYQERPEPAPAAGSALVRVRHVTLCGSDLHIWEDDFPTELPLIQGHEFSGVVEQVHDADGQGVSIGDRVAVSPMVYCGTCHACSIGRINACSSMSVLGCYEDGALTELLNVPVDKLHRVPPSLPLDLAALAEPMSIAMQAVNRGRPTAGETALVLGCGPIGLLAALYLRDLGLKVIAADTDGARIDFAAGFGASERLLVEPAGEFPSRGQAEKIDALTRGQGPSLVIEATGAPASLQNALNVVANAGRVVAVGISTRTMALSMNALPRKELDLLGSRNSQNLIPEALLVLDRHQDAARALVTHRFGFEDLDAAYLLMRSRSENVGKVVIDLPGPEADPAEANTRARTGGRPEGARS